MDSLDKKSPVFTFPKTRVQTLQSRETLNVTNRMRVRYKFSVEGLKVVTGLEFGKWRLVILATARIPRTGGGTLKGEWRQSYEAFRKMAGMQPSEVFRCARGCVRLERLINPAQPDHSLTVLYDDATLLCEVGTNRNKNLDSAETSLESAETRKTRNGCTTDSKEMLTITATDSLKVENADTGNPAPAKEVENGEEIEGPVNKNNKMIVHLPARKKEVEAVEAFEPAAEDEDYYSGDTMCAWCDDGGNLVMCDGPCMRGFHMGNDQIQLEWCLTGGCDNLDHECNPLKVPEDLRAAILNSKHPFECPNCWSRTHRCFKCSKDFKLDVTSDKPALVKSVNSDSDLSELCLWVRCDFANCGKFYCVKCQEQIVEKMKKDFHLPNRSQQAFICPLHFCCCCGSWEDASTDILFPCRRCPKAMHEKCMPRKTRDNPTRVWRVILDKDGLISPFSQVSENFFYCVRHQTQNMLQGPVHDAPLFSESLWKRWRRAYALKFRCLESSAEFIPERSKSVVAEDLSVALAALNVVNLEQAKIQQEDVKATKKKRFRSGRFNDEKELKVALDEVLAKRQQQNDKKSRHTRAWIEDAVQHVSMQEVEDELLLPFPYNRRRPVKITEDRLDFFIHSVERAKSDSLLSLDHIPSKLINQMKAALKSMRVSCAPFLQSRYTSFGRHFTKTEVLRQIAYHAIRHLKPNDLIVDFSCGANEFIRILASFCKGHSLKVRVRAYDLFTPLRMDGFVRKNWFHVRRDELDEGKNLIIGLNPPFGVNASMANQFILHAARFQPRLMLLICPPETIIPDHYSLIHEDHALCKDKAFYIPGLRADQWNAIVDCVAD